MSVRDTLLPRSGTTAASKPATPGKASQEPAVRQFREHLSTSDGLEQDARGFWTPGRPDLPTELTGVDTLDLTVVYWLPDGTAIEYDLQGNRYRVFLQNSSTGVGSSNPSDRVDRSAPNRKR
jgi:hypothetical protein